MTIDDQRLVPALVLDDDATLKEHLLRYKFACKNIKGGRVLDIACGVGYGTYMLSGFSSEAVGVDISKEAIEYASNRYKASNLVYKNMDAVNLCFPDTYFDAVVSLETIPSIEDYERFLKEIHRVLKAGGVLVLSTPTRDTVPKGKTVHVWYHKHEFVVEEMVELLEPLFNSIEIWQQKLAYYSRFYKKIRLALRYFPTHFLGHLSNMLEKRSKDLSSLSGFSRVIVFEGRYKLSILPYFDQGPKIRPTFLIFTCNRKAQE